MNIYETLLSKCPQSPRNIHYLKRYVKFIELCKLSNVSLPKGHYFEAHHICPKSKSLFPDYQSFRQHPWNKAKLTARQHLLAHVMLSKAYGGAMHEALWCMVNGKDAPRADKIKLSSRLFEYARQEFVNRHSKSMKAWWTDEQRAKRSAMYTESNHFKGKTHTDEAKAKISHNRPNAMKGKKYEVVVCPHCQKEGGILPMRQWHFDNCKFKDSITLL